MRIWKGFKLNKWSTDIAYQLRCNTRWGRDHWLIVAPPPRVEWTSGSPRLKCFVFSPLVGTSTLPYISPTITVRQCRITLNVQLKFTPTHTHIHKYQRAQPHVKHLSLEINTTSCYYSLSWTHEDGYRFTFINVWVFMFARICTFIPTATSSTTTPYVGNRLFIPSNRSFSFLLLTPCPIYLLYNSPYSPAVVFGLFSI